MSYRVHASEVYREGNFRIAMIAVDPGDTRRQVPMLKEVGTLIDDIREWLLLHTDLSIALNERCFSLCALPRLRLEDGNEYNVSYLFLAREKTMTTADWSSLINGEDLLAYEDIPLRPFPDLDNDRPAYHHREGSQPSLVVCARDTLGQLVGRNGWRINLLNSVSAQDMRVIVRPLGQQVKRRK